MNPNPSSLRSLPQTPIDNAKLRSLSSRLSTVEARIAASNPTPEIEKLKQQLSRKEKELGDLDKLLSDCVAENDVMFERFNEEIVKMSRGFKLGKGEAELLERLRRGQEEQRRLKGENMCIPQHCL